LGSTQKKSADPDGRQKQSDKVNSHSLPLTPSPLASCGREAGGEGFPRSARGPSDRQTKPDFFGDHPKKGSARLHGGPAKGGPPPWRGKKGRSVPYLSHPHACHFATQSAAEKSFVATSPLLVRCNKLKRFLIVIRVHIATLGLGRNSGASSDVATHLVDKVNANTPIRKSSFPIEFARFSANAGGVSANRLGR
jgi:hypothetical protein